MKYIGEVGIDRVGDLLKILNERSGINFIYEGKKGAPASRQDYATDVEKEVSKSKSVKILSIAGYENIGKGEAKSLLYSILKRDRGLDVEVILLNPNCNEVINERIKQLHHINPDYSQEQMKTEITETIRRLCLLKESRANDSVKIFLYCQHPVFRLIICDTCLFMSTYETDFHGHESPVYKISNLSRDEHDRLSLYNTFLLYFEKIKKLSEEFRDVEKSKE